MLPGVPGEPVGRAGPSRACVSSSQVTLGGLAGTSCCCYFSSPFPPSGQSSDAAAPPGKALRQPSPSLPVSSTPWPAFQMDQLLWAETVPSQRPQLSSLHLPSEASGGRGLPRSDVVSWGLDVRGGPLEGGRTGVSDTDVRGCRLVGCGVAGMCLEVPWAFSARVSLGARPGELGWGRQAGE